MRYSQAALHWLESIFYERYGYQFSVIETGNTIEIKLEGYEGMVVFDMLDPVFRQSRSDFQCLRWNSESEGFEPPIEANIPAPGSLARISHRPPASLAGWAGCHHHRSFAAMIA